MKKVLLVGLNPDTTREIQGKMQEVFSKELPDHTVLWLPSVTLVSEILIPEDN